MKQRTEDGREVIIEFHQVGDYVKVSAMDAVTLTALRKLKYVLEKKAKPAGGRR